MNQVLIGLESIVKVYRMGKVDVPALRGLTMSVSQGEMMAIVGASGSGKSTLLNVVGLLDRPTSGRYLFNGVDVSGLSDNQLAEMRNKELGFVFQDFNLLPRATALSNVELPLVYSHGSRRRREQAAEALERVGLGGRTGHKPSELSGGEQQRVAIARALVNNPAIILADEPTGNLDTRSTSEIMAIFHALHQEGKTVVLITHEPDIAAQAQRTIRLQDGRILAE